jgi:hypothetical protein
MLFYIIEIELIARRLTSMATRVSFRVDPTLGLGLSI